MNLMSKLQKKVGYLTMGCLLVASSVTVAASSSTQENHEYTGEEMFSAIALGQGKLAKEFPEIWSDNMYEVANTEENSLRAKNIINEIAENNSDYFVELEEAVYNEDFVKANQLLENGGKLLEEAINEDTNTNEKSKIIDGIATGTCAIFLGVYLGAVAYVDVVAWTDNYFWNGSKSKSAISDTSTLEQQQIINTLITTVN